MQAGLRGAGQHEPHREASGMALDAGRSVVAASGSGITLTNPTSASVPSGTWRARANYEYSYTYQTMIITIVALLVRPGVADHGPPSGSSDTRLC